MPSLALRTPLKDGFTRPYHRFAPTTDSLPGYATCYYFPSALSHSNVNSMYYNIFLYASSIYTLFTRQKNNRNASEAFFNRINGRQSNDLALLASRLELLKHTVLQQTDILFGICSRLEDYLGSEVLRLI